MPHAILRECWTIDPFLLLIAALAGAGAGAISSLASRSVLAAASNVIRAERFEVVDGRGRVRAVLESVGSESVRLRFFDAQNALAMQLGLYPGDGPDLVMNGPDGRMRMRFRLRERGKPILLMGDEKWEGRLQLGLTQLDDVSPSKSDVWGLLLGNPIDRELFVALAANTTPGEKAGGGGHLLLKMNDGTRWQAASGEVTPRFATIAFPSRRYRGYHPLAQHGGPARFTFQKRRVSSRKLRLRTGSRIHGKLKWSV